MKKKNIIGFVLIVMMSVFCMSCKSAPDEQDSAVSKPPVKAAGIEAEKTSDYDKYYKKDVAVYKKSSSKAGTTKNITYHSDVMDAERKAQIYLPYGYDENQKYPVIYLIHGIGCDSTQWVSMGSARIFDTFISSGKLKPFIAVYPSVIPADGLDKVSLSQKNIQAFIDFVQEIKQDLHPYVLSNYSVSEKREDTGICGLSMGGMEALRVGFTYLDMFNYIGSFSAAPTLELNLLTTKDSSYVPELVLICSGDKDTTVGTNPFNYHQELLKNGVQHLWYEHPGGSHSPDVWDTGLINFLERLGGGFVK